jgi:hypothetical protein
MLGTEPIIIVPSDPSAVINMTNVADFLENAHFVRRVSRVSLLCNMAYDDTWLMDRSPSHTHAYTHTRQVSPQEKQGARGKREKKVMVTKKLDESPEGTPLRFAVIDNPVWLQDHEWCVRACVRICG